MKPDHQKKPDHPRKPGHLQWEELLDVAEGAEDASGAVLRHLEDCDECRGRLEGIRTFMARLKDAGLEPVPETLVQSALHRLGIEDTPRKEAEESPAGRAVRRFARSAGAVVEILAELVADSRRPSPALRGSVVAQPRLLRYRSSAHEITLSLSSGPKPEGTILQGQILPLGATPLPSGGWMDLPRNEEAGRSELSEFGEFRLSVSGELGDEIAIHLPGELVRVPLPMDLA